MESALPRSFIFCRIIIVKLQSRDSEVEVFNFSLCRERCSRNVFFMFGLCNELVAISLATYLI